ncbi:hypothetical protein [Mahella australiensis]|uniref:Uncharacterized protein n=1 Tax=Mahella australiensis (strain DSM 15567 / CIP 107919 / 50-1 BON) TaxID=697281 RepID=F3ZXW4_MAHA5|nr:hypothetical protein [Mahella australiensis]AEE96634.1 hypothetical protein Mahau_1442 [Mahella australiensis 50-1 BON]
MKKSILLFILITMSMILVSCGEDERADSFEGMDSKTFLESITLPDKLSIDVNLDEVKNPSEAKTYKADYIEFDKQKLIDAFVKNNVTEEKIWAEGPQIIASDGNIKEFLSIYDGGKSFGTVTDTKGGFSYSKEINSIPSEKLDTVASILFNDPDFDAQKYGYALNSDYASYKDLDFLSYKDTLADIKRIFNVAGMPQFDVDEAYSLDLETITSHYKLYLNSEIAEDDRKNLEWTKDDECYIFSLRQLVDNIPIVNKGWQMPDGTKASAWGNPMPATCIYLVYDKTGIRKIVAYNILNITEEKENNKLINLYDALNALINNYSLTILEDDVSIISAELCYLNVPKDNMVELVPGWVFRSAKAREVDGTTFITYKYDVVNAVTGKLYPDRW